MELKNEKNKSKLNIKKELISGDLSKLLGGLIVLLLIEGIFGYVGYVYSKDNNVSISHGIIFGAIFPLGVGLLEALDCRSFFSFILYTIAYLAIVRFIPTFIGGIILLIIIGVFIIAFIDIEKKDRTEEINKIWEQKGTQIATENLDKVKEENKCDNTIINEKDTNIKYNSIVEEKGIYDKSGVYITPNELRNMDKEGLIEKEIIEDNFGEGIEYNDDIEEEFECEMCFKKISEEEYELYDCMCEECFIDVHTDENGNFHDDKFFY